MPDRAPWIDTAFGEPPLVDKVTALPNPNEEPYFVPPHQPHLQIKNELLPASTFTNQVMADETVGATNQPFWASKAAAYEQTYNPFPVMTPPGLTKLVDPPYGNPFIVGRGITGDAYRAALAKQQGDYGALDETSIGSLSGPDPPYNPNAGEDQWNPKPILPQPNVAKEIIPASGYSASVMPDEKVGTFKEPYYFAATPAPEAVFNPYPVTPDLSIGQIVKEKMA